MTLHTCLARALHFATTALAIFGLVLLFLIAPGKAVAQNACFPNVCLGTNSVLEVHQCIYGGAGGCANDPAFIEYNKPITCNAYDCRFWVAGLLGCNTNSPKLGADGVWTCPDPPKGGYVSCCSNTGSPTTEPATCASCQAWQNDTCGSPCAANQRYQYRNCNNIAGCATTRCVSDSSCSATPTPTPCPTVATPGGLTATYNGGASSTFSWNAVSNSSTPVTYGLQIDNLGSGWTSDTCAGTVQGGDTCNLNYTGTSFTRPTNLGNSFRWRVKANNACGNTSNWTAWTNYTVPTPPNCTSFGGLTSIARNTISTHQVVASGDPIQGQLAWRCGAGGTWGDWQVADYLTRASPYTFEFNSNVACGDARLSQPIQMAVNLYRGSCTNDGCRDLSPQKLALRQSLWFHA